MLGLECIMFVGLLYSLLSQMPATESGVLPDDEMQRRWKGPTVKRVEDQGNYGDNMTYYRRPSFLSCHYAFCHAANTGGGAHASPGRSLKARVDLFRGCSCRKGSGRGGEGKVRQDRSVSRMWVAFAHELRSRASAAALGTTRAPGGCSCR